MGNLGDTGNYPNKEYFVIGPDGKVASSELDHVDVFVSG